VIVPLNTARPFHYKSMPAHIDERLPTSL